MKNLPIQQSEFYRLLSPLGSFEDTETIAIATSGGADSMSLLLLAKDWSITKNIKIISLTVNHNLRSEAESEARQVGQWCKQHDIEHHILHWRHSSPQISAIQANAREARYQLMAEYCRENNIRHLLTAHHHDDQVETFFFRLARGSGLMGLSCMLPETKIYGMNILRPLLSLPKTRLIATLKEKNQEWIEDSSNQNNAYTRVVIRKQLQNIESSNISQRVMDITIKLQKFRRLVENFVKKEIDDWVEIFPQGYAIINEPWKLSKESFLYLIQILNGNKYPPRSKKLEYFLKTKIFGNSCKTSSFSGLLFEPMKYGGFLVYREANAIQKQYSIQKGSTIIWDKRFKITTNTALNIRALGGDGLKIIRKSNPELLRNAPLNRILRTIPSFWLLEELVSVPHIKYMNQDSQFLKLITSVQFYPTKQLAGSSFSVMNN